MTLIQLIVVLIVFGVVLWLINSYIPMDATFRKILNVIVVIVAILLILNAFGIVGSGPIIRLRR